MPRGNGGIIGPVNTSFSGVWSLTEAQLRRSANTWPNFYAALLSESATGTDVFSGADAADPYFEYTTLLLPGNGTNGAQNNTFLDASTNNFTITRNGNTTQGTFSPFSQTGWGNYFSGTSGQYLNTVANAAFNFGTSDFTVEAWVYPGAAIALPMPIVEIRTSASNATGFAFFRYPSAQYLSVFSQGAVIGNSTNNLTQNTWNHVALVRSGNTWTFYINGVSSGSFTWASAQSDGATTGPKIGGSTSAGEVWVGYLSNVRIVKGVAVYTGNFTPPTSPLTATQSAGTNISAITGTQTSLLTCQSNRFVDNSVANSGTGFAITVNGTPSVHAFSPFNPTASWSAATYGGSGYFDGNGDYLTAPSNTAFAFGTGAYTVEAWVYLTAFDSASSIIFSAASATNAFNIGVDNNGSFGLSKYGVGGILSTSAGDIKLNSWNHVAVSRNSTSSNDTRLYVNGVLKTTGTDSNDWTVSSAPIVGGFSTFSTYDVIGYLSDLRIVKGTAVYTGAFTPPSLIPLTTAGSTSAAAYPSTTNVNTSFASSATSLLLNFTNAGIYDATSKNDLETVGNAQISTAQSKWGGSSMYFDGNEDGLIFKTTETLLFNTGDFTIECWVNFSSVGQSQLIVGDTDFLTGNGTWGLLFNSPLSKLRLVAINAVLIIDASWSPSTSTWYHIAVARNGSSVRAFINGTQLGSTVTSSANIDNTYGSGRTYVGRQSNDATAFGWMYGYLQDLRITKGYARYTANFTPPTAAFPTL